MGAGEGAVGWDRRDVLQWNPGPHTGGLGEVITHMVLLWYWEELKEYRDVSQQVRSGGEMTVRHLSRLIWTSGVVSQAGGCSGKPLE